MSSPISSRGSSSSLVSLCDLNTTTSPISPSQADSSQPNLEEVSIVLFSPLPVQPAISTLPALGLLPKISYTPSKHVIWMHVRSVLEKISRFLRDNWKYILFYILAWALILICHHAVAMTLTIWLGIGLGIGVIVGIITSNFLDKENKYKDYNSLWNWIHYGIQQLDPHGTRQILLATIISSISALIYAIPQAVGCVIGFCIGNQISIKATYQLRFGEEATYTLDKKAHENQIASIQSAINGYQLLKHQMIMQKQIQILLEVNQSANQNAVLSQTMDSLKLETSWPLPYTVDIAGLGRSQTWLSENPNTVIEKANQCIQTLSQTLVHLKQEPDRVIEE
ncbi:hypothetical protein [Candidatus Chlamydia sanziniae]|uniref:Putative iron-sulfur cluster assembly scaffold protein n=1 Tax=Candidatus Chlamydia sanziniae TaxID=1806891 RepID=A0A1A9HVJ3_9CHLA|nr:hypothetical protein [Candidatus Chlamydia sanziniae]ANH78855.1 putative iron-sulfur cluster assembly scaffold protein [Candidatus Chlamydia sanziniae]